ncbi:MAG: translation initiation factor IF-3 [Acidobacteriaceae bacterium]
MIFGNIINQKPIKTRINQFIKAPQVRLIDQDGKMIGVMSTSEALRLAEEQQIDLVEISPNANPPVVKLLDYDKFRYQQEKQAQQSKKKIKRIAVKGIRLSVRIGVHDLEFKAKKANEFLAEGHKIKLDVVMRGREQAHPQLAYGLVDKFLALLTSPHIKESGPNRMGNMVTVIIGAVAANKPEQKPQKPSQPA